jgi:hypothetical protein
MFRSSAGVAAKLAVVLILATGRIDGQGMGHPTSAPPPLGAKSPKCTNRPVPELEDMTAKTGISFSHTSSQDKRYNFESMCGGVIIMDYDRDG